jgi:large subunit ribosomal protein L5
MAKEGKSKKEPAAKAAPAAARQRRKEGVAPPIREKALTLKERYRQEVVPRLMSELHYTNVMQVPRLEKIVLNIGLGEAIQNPKALEAAERDLTAISGQHPVITRAKKSIASFKLRAGMPVGMMVTLRGKRMYDFMEKLVNAVLPRIRDFQGVSRNSFDGRGNYNLGLKEQIVFPEVDYDKVDKIRGLEITIVTTARKDEEARRLLELMGMPFARS